MTLFDVIDGHMVTEADRLPVIATHQPDSRCIYCGTPITEPWCSDGVQCEITHGPVRDGECMHQISHRQRLAALEREIAGETDFPSGNCFADGCDHENSKWFGYGQVPLSCLERNRDEHIAWIAAHGRRS